MVSQDIRRRFLHYFKEKGHRVVASSPVIPHDDPTLLFTNAGMNQFKDVFLGKSFRDYKRAATTQKCIRVGGKHNDLENVGHTSRHLTFFEMLGNFSFGDYFKKEAIDFAWDVTLHVFGFDPKKLFASVFHEDNESFELWKKYVPEERIIRMGEKDNFWAMGDVGPCGPSSELYYDKGPHYGSARNPAEDISGERYLEFWNLVFMQYNREVSGELRSLPKPCVDTGAGLERVVALKMGVESVFETDILRSLIEEIAKVAEKPYDPHAKDAPAFHVIADHVRSLAFAIADGVQPSNIERGYVLRKVLRRAVRYGRQLGLDRPFLSQIVPKLVSLMGEDFPELTLAQSRITEILTIEEENFLRTLKRGGNILNQVIETSKKHKKISGEDAFKLKDTYGLPLEEILLIAKDADLTVDVLHFEELERIAKEKSKKAHKKEGQVVTESAFQAYFEKQGPTIFLGYHQLVSDSVVLGLLKDGIEVSSLYAGEEGAVLLDKTPFYAEKGGQVADQGTIVTENARHARFEVSDCQMPFTNVIAHLGLLQDGELHVGDHVRVGVDVKRRAKIANNHTATHLLHWALQQVLGPHVRQAGSVVEPDRLRFDFSHHKAVSAEEISQIENLVNEKIRENKPVHVYEIPFAEAQERKDIKQFFGEKYGSEVRVIDIEYSKELCGGTHTSAVGSIGYFRILKESSIAAGVRRIEATTGEDAEIFTRENEKLLYSLVDLLKAQPANAQEKMEKILTENKEFSQKIEHFRKELLINEVETFLEHIQMIGPIPFLGFSATLEAKELKECADLIMHAKKSLVLFLVGKEEGKCSIVVRVSPDLVSKGIHAQDLLKETAPLLGGKGGGKPDSAQGAGTSLEKIPEAITHAKSWVEKKHT